jgi:SRSO17 transposase
MNAAERFDHYLEHLSEGLGHSDRHAGLRGYCTGLMLPLSRKSVEPMAARVDPMHASARHQALHHFVAKAEWSHKEMLGRVCQWVIPKMDFSEGGWWIIDDTGFPKKGRHSVGVARQYCAMLGKQDNCQVAVSISLASNRGSLTGDWAADPERRAIASWPMRGTVWTPPFAKRSLTWAWLTRWASLRPSWSGRPVFSRCHPNRTAAWVAHR